MGQGLLRELEVIASTPNDKMNIALIDARRGYVYAGVYDEDLNVVSEDKHMEFSKIKEKGTFISYDNFEGKKPNIDVLKVVKKHESDAGVNPHSLNPKYLKLTEAEERLNKKNDNQDN